MSVLETPELASRERPEVSGWSMDYLLRPRGHGQGVLVEDSEME